MISRIPLSDNFINNPWLEVLRVSSVSISHKIATWKHQWHQWTLPSECWTVCGVISLRFVCKLNERRKKLHWDSNIPVTFIIRSNNKPLLNFIRNKNNCKHHSPCDSQLLWKCVFQVISSDTNDQGFTHIQLHSTIDLLMWWQPNNYQMDIDFGMCDSNPLSLECSLCCFFLIGKIRSTKQRHAIKWRAFIYWGQTL